MLHNSLQLIYACLAMILLTVAVGAQMLLTRVREMRQKCVHPQAVSTSVKMSTKLENVQPADNFKNLFEVPVLFYALMAISLAVGQIPNWLVISSWGFVVLRILHSLIHCTYNKVYHRLVVFIAGFSLLVGMWFTFALSLSAPSAT